MLSFNPARVRLVDQVNGHFLLAGNLPIIQSNGRQGVSPESLYQGMNRCLAASATDVCGQPCPVEALPTAFDLVCFSLLEGRGEEGRCVDMEMSFFEKHPDRGLFMHDDLSRLHGLGVMRDEVGKVLDQHLITRIRGLLEVEALKPRVVYVHSAFGIDRLGVMLCCYAMRYGGLTLTDALAQIPQPGTRMLDTVSQLAIEEYAMYLRRFHGVSTIVDA